MGKNRNVLMCIGISLTVFLTSSASVFAKGDISKNSNIILTNEFKSESVGNLSFVGKSSLVFDEFNNIDRDYWYRASDICNLYGNSLDNNTFELNLEKAIQATNEKSNLIIAGILNVEPNKRLEKIEDVINEIIYYLGTIGINLSQTKKQGYIDHFNNNFIKEKEKHIILHQTIFAIQYEDTGNKLVAAPLQFEIKVNSGKKRSYNLKIKALKVIDNGQ